MSFIRRELVDQHIAAYRNIGTPLATAMIADEAANLTPDELVVVWRESAVELSAELAFIEAARRILGEDVE